MGAIHVELTWPEQFFAAQAGVMRRLSAIARRRPEPYGTLKAEPWGNDIESCGAEAAVAKALGLYWESVTHKPRELRGDVGTVQVRSTPRRDGKLILHAEDKDDAPFVLVRGSFPRYEVAGWILGRHGKHERFLFKGDGRQAYFVPAESLRDMSEIPVSCLPAPPLTGGTVAPMMAV